MFAPDHNDLFRVAVGLELQSANEVSTSRASLGERPSKLFRCVVAQSLSRVPLRSTLRVCEVPVDEVVEHFLHMFPVLVVYPQNARRPGPGLQRVVAGDPGSIECVEQFDFHAVLVFLLIFRSKQTLSRASKERTNQNHRTPRIRKQ